MSFGMLLFGCALDSSGDSTEVSTRDMTIHLIAESNGTGAPLSIRMTSIIGQVRLVDGDKLRVTLASDDIPLRETQDSEGTVYTADLGDAFGDIVVDLLREQDRSATGLMALLAPPFALTSQGISGGQPLMLTWDANTGDYTVDLVIEGDCIRSLTRILAMDTGSYSVDPAEFQHISPNAPATCPLRVTMSRSFVDQRPLVPPLEGGWFYATTSQRRRLDVAWTP